MAAALTLQEELARTPPPTLAALRSAFEQDEIRDEVERITDAGHRVALAVAWWPWVGLRASTLAEANIALARILDPDLPKPLSPYKSPKGKRKRVRAKKLNEATDYAAREAEFDEEEDKETESTLKAREDKQHTSDTASEFGHHLRICLSKDEEWENFMGFASARALQHALARAGTSELREAAAALGLSNKGSKSKLSMDILLTCVQDAVASPAASAAGGDEAAARQPQRRAEDAASPAGRRIAAVAARHDEEDDSEDWTTSEDEEDEEDGGLKTAGAAMQRRPPMRPAGPAPLDLRCAIAHLNGEEHHEAAQATLDVLREAAQHPRVRGAVERLFAAASQHLAQGQFPRRMQHKAGTYYGDHRVVTLVGAPGEWVKDEDSSNLRRDATLPADDVALDWVQDVWVEEKSREVPRPGARAKTKELILGMLLSAEVTAVMAQSSGMFGWAEAASGAAGVAAREMWEPLLEWVPREARHDHQAEERLWRKLERVLSRAVGVVGICNERGLTRLLATALAMIYAVATLAASSASCHDWVWRKLLELWLEDLQQKALLGSFRLSTHRTAALVCSPDRTEYREPSPRQEPGKALKAPRQPEWAKAPSAKGREVTSGRRFEDDPSTFVWCSVCRTHRHCLWACPDVGRDLQRRAKQGVSTQVAADAVIATTRKKYALKGERFIAALDKREGRTRANLLQTLAA